MPTPTRLFFKFRFIKLHVQADTRATISLGYCGDYGWYGVAYMIYQSGKWSVWSYDAGGYIAKILQLKQTPLADEGIFSVDLQPDRAAGALANVQVATYVTEHYTTASGTQQDGRFDPIFYSTNLNDFPAGISEIHPSCSPAIIIASVALGALSVLGVGATIWYLKRRK